MLEKIKKYLRISSIAFDEEITDLINAAKKDLEISGITVDEADELIIRAISTYCKANFGFDNPDSDKLQQSYNMLKIHLSLSEEYHNVV